MKEIWKYLVEGGTCGYSFEFENRGFHALKKKKIMDIDRMHVQMQLLT